MPVWTWLLFYVHITTCLSFRQDSLKVFFKLDLFYSPRAECDILTNISGVVLLVNTFTVYVLLPVILLLSSRVYKKHTVLDKEYTDSLKGLFALYIAIHHYSQNLSNPGALRPMHHIGFLCVSFFFLSSGYGLKLSYEKNHLHRFWLKRLTRLYVPFVIANIATSVMYFLSGVKEYTLSHIIITSLTMRTVYSGILLWYILIQFIMYIFFYVSYSIGKNAAQKNAILLTTEIIYIYFCAKNGISIWRYNTVLCFFLGVLLATYRTYIIGVFEEHYSPILAFLTLPVGFFWFAIYCRGWHYQMSSIISSTCFALILTVTSSIVHVSSKLLHHVGNASYEFYIVQYPTISIVLSLMGQSTYALLFILVSASVSSLITHKLSLKICQIIDAKN